MRAALQTFLFATLLAFAARGQSTAFVCPTATLACNSYQELRAAGDKNVTAEDVRYVCFRDASDEFFLIKFSSPPLYPSFWYRWSHTLADYEPNFNAKREYSLFTINTFVNGVADVTRVPNVFTTGAWTQYDGHFVFGTYASRRNVSVTMDDTQIVYDTAYIAQSKKKVEYSLTLQLSTRRFTERFVVPNEPKDPGLDNTGRCAEVHPLPRFPDPPELTDEQQEEQGGLKTKLDYCASSDFTPQYKAYCDSNYIFLEDYEAAIKKAAKKPQPKTPPKKN